MDAITKQRNLWEDIAKGKKLFYWLVVCGLMIHFVFYSPYSVVEYLKVNTEHKRLVGELDRFIIANKALREKIDDLETNPETWKKIAREEYGMQEKDEKVIIFTEEP